MGLLAHPLPKPKPSVKVRPVVESRHGSNHRNGLAESALSDRVVFQSALLNPGNDFVLRELEIIFYLIGPDLRYPNPNHRRHFPAVLQPEIRIDHFDDPVPPFRPLTHPHALSLLHSPLLLHLYYTSSLA